MCISLSYILFVNVVLQSLFQHGIICFFFSFCFQSFLFSLVRYCVRKSLNYFNHSVVLFLKCCLVRQRFMPFFILLSFLCGASEVIWDSCSSRLEGDHGANENLSSYWRSLCWMNLNVLSIRTHRFVTLKRSKLSWCLEPSDHLYACNYGRLYSRAFLSLFQVL